MNDEEKDINQPAPDAKPAYAPPRIVESGAFEHLVLACLQQLYVCAFDEFSGANS